MRKAKLNLNGERFNTILVTGKSSKPRYWKCRCDCGREFQSLGSRLKAGKVKCICQRTDKHGDACRDNHSPTYRAWQGMKSRIKSDKNYAHVRLDPRWESYKNFKDDMGPMPEGYSLDRVNPFLGYGPGNCRWAPPDVQAANKRGAYRVGCRVVDPSTGSSYRAAVGTIAEWSWYLRESTNNPEWTKARLKECLKVMSLTDVMFVAFPFGITPEGLHLMVSREFKNMWGGCLESLYLRRAA